MRLVEILKGDAPDSGAPVRMSSLPVGPKCLADCTQD